MKNIFTFLFICLSIHCFSSEYFKVCKKDEVEEFINDFNRINEEINRKEETNIKFQVLDIKLDNSIDGWAVVKYSLINR